MNEELITQIGLEIHVQLKTKSKMFCGCDNNAQDKEPNTVICPICLGMPGTLPVANKAAIEMTLKTGIALGSIIPKVSKFDRKHYFYPDLPKGYQISQYDQPFCVGGCINVDGKTVTLNRIHLEEDAGKLVHPEGSNNSIVDLNRAGTPLMEIVTEPDIESPVQARGFLKELQIILRSIGVSDADMEKGHLRCDANISVKSTDAMSEIVEIKNLNSFKFVEKALIVEEERLRGEYPNWPKNKKKVTRGFDSKISKTFIQRDKEEAKDYRYFPEPDLPPFITTDADVERLRSGVSDLPSKIRQDLVNSGISQNEADIIARNKWMLEIIKKSDACDEGVKAILGKVLVHEKGAKDKEPDFLISLAKIIYSEDLPSSKVRKILESGKIDKSSESPSSAEQCELLARKTIQENPEVVQKYRSGKTQVIGFLIGQVVRESGGAIEPSEARDQLIKNIGGENAERKSED